MQGYYGTPARTFETQTEKGIRGISNALIVDIVASLLFMVASLALLAIAGQLNTGDYMGLLASAVGILALLCSAIALYLVVIIFGIIGFWAMHKGRMEYGTAHDNDMSRAMMMFIAAIVFFFAAEAVSVASEASTIFGAGTGGITNTSNPVYGVVAMVLGVIFSLTIALILYYAVKAFILPERQNLAIGAVGLYVLSPVFSNVLSLLFAPPADFMNDPGSIPFDPLWLLPGIVGGIITLVALLLFYLTYSDVRGRLKSRQIKPFWGTMASPTPFQTDQYRWQPPPSS